MGEESGENWIRFPIRFRTIHRDHANQGRSSCAEQQLRGLYFQNQSFP